jgi:plastocyanin
MAVYFVIGGALVAWALVLTFGGMARAKDFPDKHGGRLLMTVSVGLAVSVFVALLATTDKEHPRREAKEKAAEKAKEERAPGEAPPGRAPSGTVGVTEKEYSVELAGGTTLAKGASTFDVANKGKIQHNLAVEGGGGEKKTPLIDPGQSAKLKVELKPGKYKLYCTVPGHEQLGMKTEVTVR